MKINLNLLKNQTCKKKRDFDCLLPIIKRNGLETEKRGLFLLM